MSRTRRIVGTLVWSVVVGGLCVAARNVGGQAAAFTMLTVAADKPGAAIASTLYGIFFEDINFGADGGIYAERVKNRSFEFPDPLMGWKQAAVDGARGRFTVETDKPPSARNPHYLRITSAASTFGVTNDGFRGIGVSKGQRYRFAVHARLASEAPVTLRAELENARNVALGGATLTGFTRQWQRYTGTIVAETTDARARLRLLVHAPGALDVDMVSLFPEDTWSGRENGLRRDLIQLLKDLQPGFIRFPGGCIVEGRFLDGRYQWKTTIGDPANRRLIINRWNDEFPHRATPDYYQTFGLGFFEYFQLAEDLGAEPLPILNCGMACQFNSNELAPLTELDPYIQDALDLIEFANGAATSAWGRRRVEMGHPAPFNLKFVGVGNEQWGPQYVERYERFAAVLKKRHPEIRLVSSAGPSPSGERFDFLWQRMRELKADLVDEHYYMPPTWFLTNVHRYDSYPRTGPKVFAGEYAAHAPVVAARGQRPSTLAVAIAEAAFMTGLERNADIVELSSYAPLFAHVDAWQWTPNLIWFDNLRSYGTPSYYVQKLFGTNRGTHVLPVAMEGLQNGQSGLFASASIDARMREVILKVVNSTVEPRRVRVDLTGKQPTGAGRALVLTGDPNGENSLDAPNAIAPTERKLDAPAQIGDQMLAPHSLTVFRIPIE
jgi:alpha-L-arabinofuranosidase